MIKLQLVSSVSGAWDVGSMPLGWDAVSVDYDGAEDSGDTRSLWASTITELVSEIRNWEIENEY